MEEILIPVVEEFTNWDRAVIAAQIASGVGLILLILLQLKTLAFTRNAVDASTTSAKAASDSAAEAKRANDSEHARWATSLPFMR